MNPVTTTGVGEVVDAQPIHADLLRQLEDWPEVLAVQPMESEADACAQARALRCADARDRFLEGVLLAPQFVMRGPDRVQAHAYVGEARRGDALGLPAVDERAVRGQDRAHPQCLCVRRQLEHVGAHQRLAAGEQHGGDAEVRKVGEHPLALLEAELTGVVVILRARVAVQAVQVATPGYVPHHYRLLVRGEVQEMGWAARRRAPVAQGISGLDLCV